MMDVIVGSTAVLGMLMGAPRKETAGVPLPQLTVNYGRMQPWPVLFPLRGMLSHHLSHVCIRRFINA